MKLRETSLTDAAAIAFIEQESQLHPWSESQLAQSLASCSISYVIEDFGQVVAYILVSVVLGEAEILNLAVLPDFQGKGLGSQLINAVLDECCEQSIFVVHLEVRKSNLRAIHLYEKNQFKRVGERQGYYARTAHTEVDDAILMTLNTHNRCIV